MLDYPAADFWFNLGQWVFNGVVAICLWFSRKNTATNKRLETVNAKLSGRIDDTEKKIIRACADLEHLPDQGQFYKLGEDITALRSELAEVRGRLTGVNRAVDLINEFLINQGANK
jgi:predicted  nucleic acid-binding Zn-ribbon protein